MFVLLCFVSFLFMFFLRSNRFAYRYREVPLGHVFRCATSTLRDLREISAEAPPYPSNPYQQAPASWRCGGRSQQFGTWIIVAARDMRDRLNLRDVRVVGLDVGLVLRLHTALFHPSRQ